MFKQRHLLVAVLSSTVLTLAPSFAQDKPAPKTEKKSETDLITQARQLEAQRWVLRAGEAAKQGNHLLALELSDIFSWDIDVTTDIDSLTGIYPKENVPTLLVTFTKSSL